MAWRSVAAEGTIAPLVGDVLARTLRARISWCDYPAAEIRAALVAAPRGPASSGRVDALQGDFTESLDDLRALASREPVIQVVNALLAEAARSGASDVHFESTTDGLRVRMRRDGVLQDVQRLGAAFQAGVLSRLKVVAGLDIAERRLPQDGRARVRIDERDIDIRVSTLPALHGESLVLRLLDSGGAHESLAHRPGHHAGRAGRVVVAGGTQLAACCWSPAPRARARPPRCTRRSPRAAPTA